MHINCFIHVTVYNICYISYIGLWYNSIKFCTGGVFVQTKHFEYVREIAQQGSITKAAEKLYISQQALSEALKLLEEELGFKIFSRSYKGVVLTQSGEFFLRDLEHIMPIIRGWDRLIENESQKQTVKILLQYVLSDLLSQNDFIKTLSNLENVDVKWETDGSLPIIEKIQKEEFSIGILHLTVESQGHNKLQELLQNSHFIVEKIMENKMSVIIQKKDILAKKKLLTYDDLYEKQMVNNQMFAQSKNAKKLLQFTKESGFSLPQSVNIVDFVSQNENTFAYIPTIVAQKNSRIRNGELEMCYLKEEPEYAVYLVYSKPFLKFNERIVNLIKHFLMEISL